MFETRVPFKNSREHLKEELALIELHIKKQITIMKLANPLTVSSMSSRACTFRKRKSNLLRQGK